MSPWLTLVGIGEDGLDGLGAAARRALAEAELVVGGARHLALVGETAAPQLRWASPIEDTFPAIVARRGTPVAVLASGDPFCYGVGATLARHVPAAEMRCLPQPSAFSLMAARLGWALQDCITLSLHGRPIERIIAHLRPGARILALSWDGTTPAALAALLAARGFGPSRVTVGEALGGPRERLWSAEAASFGRPPVDPLNTIALEVAAEAHVRPASLTPGRSETFFDHDGQITKARIRAMTLAALAPSPGELLWDIGAGSGSVGIEWMLLHPQNRTIAVEPQGGRAARIRANALSLGVPDLRVVEGLAPAALAGLPTPDAVFVGGGVTVARLLDAARAALRSGGRLVANAVTVEGQGVLARALTDYGGELSSVSIALADPVGRFHGWRPAMPVTQWIWIKP